MILLRQAILRKKSVTELQYRFRSTRWLTECWPDIGPRLLASGQGPAIKAVF
jgi:hypothetical protein